MSQICLFVATLFATIALIFAPAIKHEPNKDKAVFKIVLVDEIEDFEIPMNIPNLRTKDKVKDLIDAMERFHTENGYFDKAYYLKFKTKDGEEIKIKRGNGNYKPEKDVKITPETTLKALRVLTGTEENTPIKIWIYPDDSEEQLEPDHNRVKMEKPVIKS